MKKEKRKKKKKKKRKVKNKDAPSARCSSNPFLNTEYTPPKVTSLIIVGAVPFTKGRMPPSLHMSRAVREKDASSCPQVWYLMALAGLRATPFKAPVCIQSRT